MNRELFHDFSQLLISLALLAGCFYFLDRVFFSGIQVAAEHRESLLQVTGGVIGIIGTVAGFWLGTSLSSLRKDSALSSQLTKGAP
jgi:hypothetical protein